MDVTIQRVLGESGVAFGTSGARGLVTQLTDEVCAAFTAAFLSVMRGQGRVDRLAIGRDLRPSSPAMAAACTAAAKALGVEVNDYGVLPTPALALQAMADGAPAIMITGSHIPFDRNGIKFYRPEGEITKADESAIMAAQGELPTLAANTPQPASARAWEAYVARYAEWFVGQPLAGWRVGLYQHSAAGRDLNHQVLEALGAEVVVLGRSEDFVPVDTEAVGQADRERGQAWAEEHGLEALLSTDGDGDRPLLGDERGHWLRGDIVGLLCARELGIQALAVPVSCNTAIDACGAFEAVRRTRIGSPYVLAEMEVLASQYSRVAGFEANGGFLLGSDLEEGERRLGALPTRDALLPALTLMVTAARRGVALSALVGELPARYTASDRLQRIPARRSQELLASWTADNRAMCQALDLKSPVSSQDTTDGLRVTLQDGEIVHLRPSGNAPELRCYVEAGSEERAQGLVALLRYFNPIGAHPSGQIGEDPRGIPNNLMPFIAQVAVGRRPELSIFGDDYPTEDGTCVRDYLHVMDLAAGHAASLASLEQSGVHAYNLGTGQGVSVLEMVRTFEQVTGQQVPYRIAPRRDGDLAAFWADASKAERELGWRAERGLKAMLRDTWRWQEQNPQGYD